MRIAMIGSGAAGSVFASYLLLGGADITLVDPYKEHMDKVAADGMMFIVKSDTVSEKRLDRKSTRLNSSHL